MAEILGVRVDNLNQAELEGKLRGFLAEDRLHKVFTPNAEILLEARRNESFKDCLNSGDLNIADGVSILFASRFLSFLNTKVVQKIENRLPGVDVLLLLCKVAAEEGKSVLFYGSGPGVAEKAAEVTRKMFPGLTISGFDPGIVDLSEKWSLGDHSCDIVAVALGHPKQEQFICSSLGDVQSLRVAIGVGGALDYISGNVKRAPKWMRRLGFEWLYRLYQQPRRIKRIFNAVVVFPLVVIYDRIKAL